MAGTQRLIRRRGVIARALPVVFLSIAATVAADTAEDSAAVDQRPVYNRQIDRFGTLVKGSGGIESWHRVNTSRELDTDFSFYIAPRKTGEASLPFIRVDVGYQDVDTGGHALDYRLEFGYGPFAFQARDTRFDVPGSADEHDFVQMHALYRMSCAALVEIDLGLGVLTVDRPEHREAFSLTLPILVHPSDHYGFEFRPAWSKVSGERVTDYDLNLLLGARYVSLRVGYRWVESVSDTYNGPQIGVAVRW